MGWMDGWIDNIFFIQMIYQYLITFVIRVMEPMNRYKDNVCIYAYIYICNIYIYVYIRPSFMQSNSLLTSFGELRGWSRSIHSAGMCHWKYPHHYIIPPHGFL